MTFMINKLTKFVALAAIAALISVGCAKAPPPVRSPEPAPHVEPTPVPPVKASSGYSVSLDGGWTLVEQTPMEGDEPQRVAEYELKLSEDLELGAYVMRMKLDKDEASKFLDRMKEEAAHTDGIKLLGQRMVKHDDVEAYESLTAMKMAHGVALVLAISIVDDKGNAFFVTCGGDIQGGETVLEACRPFIKSFVIAK